MVEQDVSGAALHINGYYRGKLLIVYWIGSKLKQKALEANFWRSEWPRKDGIGDACRIGWAYKGYVVYHNFESR